MILTKRIFARIVTWVFLISHAYLPALAQQTGVYTSGQQLLEYCSKKQGELLWGVCIGYISGIADLAPAPLTIEGIKLCLPPVTRQQLHLVVLKFLKDHPEKLHHPASYTVFAALIGAFPCTQ